MAITTSVSVAQVDAVTEFDASLITCVVIGDGAGHSGRGGRRNYGKEKKKQTYR